MRTTITALMVLALALLSSCSTFRGMGEDFENLGRGIKKTLEEHEEKRR